MHAGSSPIGTPVLTTPVVGWRVQIPLTDLFPDGSNSPFHSFVAYLYNAMKHILTGTAGKLGGMPSESSKVVMGMIAIPAVTKSQFLNSLGSSRMHVLYSFSFP